MMAISTNWKTARNVAVVLGILLIVGYEVASTLKQLAIERIGGEVSSMGEASFSGTVIVKNGSSISFKTPINDQQLQEIAGSLRSFKRLMLELPKTQITDVGIRALAGAKNIVSLDVSETGLTDDALDSIGTMTNLVQLDLTNCRISDAGLPRLKRLVELKVLLLGDTSITDAGLEHLTKLKALEYVGISGHGVTPAGTDRLKKALPNAMVWGPTARSDPLDGVRVTAQNGNPLPIDGGPVIDTCRDYFQAWQQRDVHQLKTLLSKDLPFSFHGMPTFDIMRGIRPREIVQFSGFASDQAATVIIAGPSEDRGLVHFEVQLVKEQDVWRIAYSRLVELRPQGAK